MAKTRPDLGRPELELTELQEQLLALYDEHQSYAYVARISGVNANKVRSNIGKARQKIERYRKAVEAWEAGRVEHDYEPARASRNTLEHKDPERAAAAMEAIADPTLETVAAKARASGLAPATVKALERRLDRESPDVMPAVKGLTTQRLLRDWEDLTKRALGAITDEKLGEAPAEKLAVIAAIGTDKRAILRGEPTQIVKVQDEGKLKEIASACLKRLNEMGEIRVVDVPRVETPEVHPDS